MTFQKRINGVLSVLLLVVLLFAACGEQPADTDDASGIVSSVTATENAGDDFAEQSNVKHTDLAVGFQLEAPSAGEKAAVLHTNYGDIYIRLFPEIAPKTVENFIGLIEKGYYNGLIFHRIIDGFCVQGGDPQGDGRGGNSLWGDKFEDEFCSELLNLKYAVAMANSGPDSNGSQFFIDHAVDGYFSRANYAYETMKANHDAAYNQYYSMYDQYAAYYGDSFTVSYPSAEAFAAAQAGAIAPDARVVPDAVWDLYEQQGGNIGLDGAWRETGGHSVFGQVYQGMDVVDTIAAVEVDDNDKPVQDVVIESAEVITVS